MMVKINEQKNIWELYSWKATHSPKVLRAKVKAEELSTKDTAVAVDKNGKQADVEIGRTANW